MHNQRKSQDQLSQALESIYPKPKLKVLHEYRKPDRLEVTMFNSSFILSWEFLAFPAAMQKFVENLPLLLPRLETQYNAWGERGIRGEELPTLNFVDLDKYSKSSNSEEIGFKYNQN